jgi:hypothetical protein
MQLLPTKPHVETKPETHSLTLSPRHLRNSVFSAGLALLWLIALWFVLPGHVPFATAQSTSDVMLDESTAAGVTAKEATIIVQFDNESRIVRHVEFTTPISGLAALHHSGLDVVFHETVFGPAVCSIEGVGCPASDCFCNENYWGYNYWDGEQWRGYEVGPASSTISESGAIEAWRWGTFGEPLTSVSPTLAAASALDWLQARQTISNGGYGSAAASIESLLAVGSNGMAATEWRRGPTGQSLASYVRVYGAGYSRTTPGAAGKSAVAWSAGEVCLPVNAMTPQHYFSATVGAYSDQNGPNSWAILGAVAINESVPASAVNALRESALPEGGWEWAPSWGADTNTTALAIQALIATGEAVTSSMILQGLDYIASVQNEDGGFPYAAGIDAKSDVNSTAYVVQAIIAAGQDPHGQQWSKGNNTPIRYLLSMQLADGSFEWQPGTGTNQLATVQAIPALLGQAYPVATSELARCPAIHIPSISKP